MHGGPSDRRREQELDPALLLWWAHSRIDAAALPDRRVVLAFVLSQPTFRAWLVVDDAGVSVCKVDPGFEVDATLTTPVTTLAEVWLGRVPISDALRRGDLVITGRRDVVDAVPRALLLSEIAGVVHEAEQARKAAAGASGPGA